MEEKEKMTIEQQEEKTNKKSRKGGAHAKPKKKSLSQKILLALTIICLVGAVISGGLILMKYLIIRHDQSEADKLYQKTESSEEVAPESEPELDPTTGIISDFNALYNVNQDIKGYVYIDGTGLSSVVVQSDDNDYYLRRNFYGKSILGIPFIDYRAEITPTDQSQNLTLYGHAASDGSYFAPIKEYKSLDFYKQHPIINFDTIYGRGQYKVIGAFMAEVDPDMEGYFGYHDYVDMTKEQFETFLLEIDKRSYFNTTVDVDYSDRFITLSTCETLTPEKPTPYRMVVVARKVRPGEPYAVNVEGATINKDMIMPEVWVEQNGKANPYA